MASNPLGVAAIVCGMAAIGACFLDWAEPRRPAGDIVDELRRGLDGPDRIEDPSPLLRNLRQAYPAALTATRASVLRQRSEDQNRTSKPTPT